jgi:hypothetical protein
MLHFVRKILMFREIKSIVQIKIISFTVVLNILMLNVILAEKI